MGKVQRCGKGEHEVNIDKLRQDLEIDEGIKHEVYLDHLNLKTGGIGHLFKKNNVRTSLSMRWRLVRLCLMSAFSSCLSAI